MKPPPLPGGAFDAQPPSQLLDALNPPPSGRSMLWHGLPGLPSLPPGGNASATRWSPLPNNPPPVPTLSKLTPLFSFAGDGCRISLRGYEYNPAIIRGDDDDVKVGCLATPNSPSPPTPPCVATGHGLRSSSLPFGIIPACALSHGWEGDTGRSLTDALALPGLVLSSVAVDRAFIGGTVCAVLIPSVASCACGSARAAPPPPPPPPLSALSVRNGNVCQVRPRGSGALTLASDEFVMMALGATTSPAYREEGSPSVEGIAFNL